MNIQEGNLVFLEFKVLSEGGELIDQAGKEKPFEYIHGFGDIHPELEKELAGKTVGDEFTVTLPPEKMYGQWEESNISYVKREQFPDNMDIKEGMWVSVKEKGENKPARIIKNEEDIVALDMNHPLAGQSITYDLKVLDIKETQKLKP